MKTIKFFLILALQLAAFTIFAQSPQLINYQGIARDANGTPITGNIDLRFEFHQGSASSPTVFSEQQTVTTTSLGLFVTQIGKTSNLNTVNWESGSLFLEVSVSLAGGPYVSLGTQQLVSAPYALHASSVPATYVNNILTIGTTTLALSPTLAVTPNTSITLSGLGSVSSSGTNTFDINIPAPSFTNAGPTTISGTYPNYTVNSSTGITYTSGTGIAINSGTIINTLPNITPSIAVTNTVAAASSVSSSGSSFSINVVPPAFTNAGPATITGAYPNYTITSPAATNYSAGTGIAITSGTIINTAPDVTPTVAVTTTAAAGASVTSSGSSFSINVPAPIFTNSGQNIISGTYPNYTVNTPSLNVSAGTGISVTSGSVITNTAPDQLVAFTNTGQNIITGTYPNFSVNTPTVTPVTITGSGLVTALGSPNYTVDVPSPVFTNVTQNLITGSYPNYSVNTPTLAASLSATAGGSPSISVSGNSFNLNIPPVTGWSLLGNTGTSTLTNFIGTTDNVALMFRVNNQKAGAIDPVQLNAFFGNQSGLSNSTGSLNAGMGQSALNANTTGMMNAGFGYRALAANTTGNGNAGLGSDALLLNTSGIFNAMVGLNSGRANTTGSSNSAIGKDALHNNSSGSNNVALGFQSGFSALGNGNVFLGSSAGYNETGSNKFYLANSSTATTPLMYGDFSTNSIGIGTVTPYGNFHVYSAGTSVMTRISSASALTGLVQYADGSSSAILNYENTPLYFGTNGANRMVISNTGAVGIGNSLPTATLHVTGNMRLVDGNQAAGKVLTSDASGNASWQPASATGWASTGNSGTSAGTNFIGTTDAQDLVVKSNNTEVFRSQSAGVLRMAAGADRTITMQTQTSNIDGNNLFVRGSDAGIGGQARYGGALVVQGGDGYNQSNAIHFGGSVVIRPGKNQYGSASYNSGSVIFQSVNSSNTYFEVARMDPNGNFGLGVSTPAYQLELSTNSAAKPTSNAWTTTSDSRLKTNVHAYEGGLAELIKINPVWFTYTGEAEMPRETGVGVIAQDLQKIAPYMIKEWQYTPKNMKGEPDHSAAKTTYLGVDNGPMTYMIINAIKDQQKQIEELKKITEEQRKIIEELLKTK